MSIWVSITHSALPLRSEKKFDPEITIENLKNKLYPLCGTNPQHQRLQLLGENGQVIAELEPGNAPLAAFPIAERIQIHIIDTDPTNSLAALNDVSTVQKFTISEEAYSKRTDNFRNFKQKHLREHTQKQQEAKEEAKKRMEEEEEKQAQLVGAISVGSRCEIGSGTEFPKRGVVQFVGEIEQIHSIRVGVQLDEPVGDCDGRWKNAGSAYFACRPRYGVFVRPSEVQVGDFPEINDEDEDEI
eukprot:TRINITY_DN8347_c0_g1_i1.p1 TRINITY_DN8347_c0_g1~~TRINITY_DN8347_c0_g1_i1.p1  ORF type:complete len:243 (-),score=48.97 TRINITY_DN8347_c0_g1_i1:52-780(-)